MKITNKLGLPQPIIGAIETQQADYNRGKSDITVTQMIDPPQIVQLRKQHEDDLSEDAGDMLWSLMGTAMHKILEEADSTALVEERLYLDAEGWTLGGKFDRMVLLPEGVLQDYKFSSVWEYIFGLKPERIAQLNVLAELAIHNGYDISSLEVVMLFRDWKPMDAKFKDGYPKSQIARIPVKLWSRAERQRYIRERIQLHQKADQGEIPHCTDEERWANNHKWAVMKRSRKSALKVCNSREEADEYMAERGLAEDDVHYIEFRQGDYIRCQRYCPVASVCPQWAHDKPE